MSRLRFLAGSLLLASAACSPSTEGPSGTGTIGPIGPSQSTVAASFDPSTLGTCEEAFRLWVANSASLNSPETDIFQVIVVQESIQRRVFELCSLSDAELYNSKYRLEIAPGIKLPMIEPDFRTFAEVECVDEGPLLVGTPLCAEVAP